VAPPAQHRADFILRLRHAPRDGHRADVMFVVRWMMFPVGAIRHDDLIFHAWILEELAFAMFKYANHAIGKSLDGNRLVDRVFA